MWFFSIWILQMIFTVGSGKHGYSGLTLHKVENRALHFYTIQPKYSNISLPRKVCIHSFHAFKWYACSIVYTWLCNEDNSTSGVFVNYLTGIIASMSGWWFSFLKNKNKIKIKKLNYFQLAWWVHLQNIGEYLHFQSRNRRTSLFCTAMTFKWFNQWLKGLCLYT